LRASHAILGILVAIVPDLWGVLGDLWGLFLVVWFLFGVWGRDGKELGRRYENIITFSDEALKKSKIV
jgi:hypothetical protein